MKSLVGKFGTLAMLAAIGGVAVQGCSSDLASPSRTSDSSEGDSGLVTLNLVPVTGITVNSVNYVVTGTPAIPGTPLPSGVLPTPGTTNNFNVGISVPVGTGYTLSLTAVSAEEGDNITCTGSHGPFDVAPNASTAFPMTLTCVDNSNGGVVATVDVETNACPKLIPDYATAIPGKANVGSSIALNALGHDLDGKVVTYAWSIPAGNASAATLGGATTQAATLNCLGQADIPVTVTMKNGECSKTLLTSVSCKSVECNNGVLNPGEDCDPAIAADQPGGSPAGTTFGCPSDCKVACGDGVVEAPTEQCELNGGPENGSCTAQCRTRVKTCDDGFLTGDEPCDTNGTGPDLFAVPPGPNTTCTAQCTLGATVCGNGVLEAGEECEPNNTANCSNDCKLVASTECTACETESACAPFALACTTSTGTQTPENQALCYDVAECIQRTGCADGTNTFTSCFCGALSTADCGAAPDTGPNAPKGPCAAEIKAGMGAGATNSQILSRFTNRNFAAGAGINRFNCLKNNPVCSPLCGF
jgi:hypothetical protein